MNELSHAGLFVCFWCGRDVGVLLDTRLRKTLPRRCVHDYQPCDECKREFARGVVLIEATPSPASDNQLALAEKYPTGRWAVITEESAQRIFGDHYKGHRRLLIDPTVAERLGVFRDQPGPGAQP